MSKFYSVDDLYLRLGFTPFNKFSIKQRKENLSHSDSFRKECDGFRQTGRTTRQLCKAIAKVLSGADVEYIVNNEFSLNYCRDKTIELLDKLFLVNWSVVQNDVKVGDSTISFKLLSSSRVVYFEPSFNDF